MDHNRRKPIQVGAEKFSLLVKSFVQKLHTKNPKMHNFNDQISDGQYRAPIRIEMQLWEESDVIPPLAALLPFGGG
jgi:hypothetical protein